MRLQLHKIIQNFSWSITAVTVYTRKPTCDVWYGLWEGRQYWDNTVITNNKTVCTALNPFDAHVKSSFVIFDIRALYGAQNW